MTPTPLHLESVSCAVPGRTLFTGLDLRLESGQSLAVTGASGTGKSTLLATILGLAPPQSGRVQVAGRDMAALSARAQAAVRRAHIGIVFQEGELIDELTATENVAIAFMLAEAVGDPMERARSELARFGVPPDTKAVNLSGGERQRTAVARAMSSTPALVLADEPTGSLDTVTRDLVAEDLFQRCRETNAALLIVTHDPTVARRADNVISLEDYRADTRSPLIEARPNEGVPR